MCIPGTKDLQLLCFTCVTYAKVFLGSTYILSTSSHIINIMFCLLAHAQSFFGSGPDTLDKVGRLFHLCSLEPGLMHAQLSPCLDLIIPTFTKLADPSRTSLSAWHKGVSISLSST